jgi:hypothetical protein
MVEEHAKRTMEPWVWNESRREPFYGAAQRRYVHRYMILESAKEDIKMRVDLICEKQEAPDCRSLCCRIYNLTV